MTIRFVMRCLPFWQKPGTRRFGALESRSGLRQVRGSVAGIAAAAPRMMVGGVSVLPFWSACFQKGNKFRENQKTGREKGNWDHDQGQA
jgi:hypothetical protein